MQIHTTLTIDEFAQGAKAVLSFTIPDQKSGKVRGFITASSRYVSPKTCAQFVCLVVSAAARGCSEEFSCRLALQTGNRQQEFYAKNVGVAVTSVAADP